MNWSLLASSYGAVFGNVQVLLMTFLGALGGVLLGAIPGMTATMGVALLIPFSFGMDLIPSIGLLLGIYLRRHVRRLDFRHPDSRAGHPGRGGHAAGRLPDVPEGSGGQGAFRRHVRVLRRRRHRRADYDLPLPDHCGYGHELRPRRNVHAGGLRSLRDRRHLRQVHRQGSCERLLRHAAVHRRPRPDQRHPALHHL